MKRRYRSVYITVLLVSGVLLTGATKAQVRTRGGEKTRSSTSVSSEEGYPAGATSTSPSVTGGTEVQLAKLAVNGSASFTNGITDEAGGIWIVSHAPHSLNINQLLSINRGEE